MLRLALTFQEGIPWWGLPGEVWDALRVLVTPGTKLKFSDSSVQTLSAGVCNISMKCLRLG